MDIHSFYEAVGGSYEEVMSRLMKEDRIYKYLGKFSSAEYNELIGSVEKGDYETAFRAAHTMKGVCANLGLKNLGDIASATCELMRPKEGSAGPEAYAPKEDIAQYLDKLAAEFENTTSQIKLLFENI